MVDFAKDGGKPIEPGLIEKLLKVGADVSKAAYDSWQGPGVVAPAEHPELAGRRYDLPAGYNLRRTIRSEEPITFAQLRSLSEACELMRLAIERRKDQMSTLEWSLRPRGDTPLTPEVQVQIDYATALLSRPDGVHNFRDWQRIFHEDLFVIDAVTIEPRYTVGGDLVRLDIVDGSTINLKIDDFGRTPEPPDTAYVQQFKGSNAVNFTTKELIYRPRNIRPHKNYGFSPVEQVIILVNTSIRRSLSKLDYYTDGSMPDLLLSMPDGTTVQQITDFAEDFNGDLSGNMAERRKARFVPHGTTVLSTKDAVLKDPFDEWLARLIAFAFSIPPNAFIQTVVKAMGETLEEAAKAEGLLPIIQWEEDLINDILWNYGNLTLIEFTLKDEREVDPKFQAEVDKLRLAMGLTSIDKLRERDGEEPLATRVGPMIETTQGWVTPEQFITGTVAAPLAPGAPAPVMFVRAEKDKSGARPAKTTDAPEGIDVSAPGTTKSDAEPELEGTKLVKIKRNDQIPVSEDRYTSALASFFEVEGPRILAMLLPLYPEPEPKEEGVEAMVRADISDELKRVIDDIDMSGWSVLIAPSEDELLAVGAAAGASALTDVTLATDFLTNRVTEAVVDYSQARAAELVGMTRVAGPQAGILAGDPTAKFVPGRGWFVTSVKIREGAPMAISEGTRKIIQDEVTYALTHESTRDELAKSIMDKGFSRRRAKLIAQTELDFANSEATFNAWEASGAVKGKKWLLSNLHAGQVPKGDICDVNAQQGTIPFQDFFASGQKTTPAHPGCSCDVAAEVEKKA